MFTLLYRIVLRGTVLAGSLSLGSVIADVTDPSSTTIDALLKGGPFAVVLGLFLIDKLDTTGERNILRIQLAESQERERKLYDKITTETAPALLDNNRLLADNTKTFNETVKPLLERVARSLEKRG